MMHKGEKDHLTKNDRCLTKSNGFRLEVRLYKSSMKPKFIESVKPHMEP